MPKGVRYDPPDGEWPPLGTWFCEECGWPMKARWTPITYEGNPKQYQRMTQVCWDCQP